MQLLQQASQYSKKIMCACVTANNTKRFSEVTYGVNNWRNDRNKVHWKLHEYVTNFITMIKCGKTFFLKQLLSHCDSPDSIHPAACVCYRHGSAVCGVDEAQGERTPGKAPADRP